MPQDAPLYGAPTFVITTDDGTLFSCAPHAMGGDTHPRALRWKLIDARGVENAGPLYRGESSAQQVQALVSAWWEEQQRV